MSSTSSTFEEAKEAIAQLFNTVWGVGQGYTFQLGNEEFTKPASDPWARLAIRHRGSTQHTLGEGGCRKFERSGAAFVQIFVPGGEGENRMNQLVGAILTGFEGERIADTTVCFRDVIPREAGDRGKWYQVTIEIVFDYIEIK